MKRHIIQLFYFVYLVYLGSIPDLHASSQTAGQIKSQKIFSFKSNEGQLTSQQKKSIIQRGHLKYLPIVIDKTGLILQTKYNTWKDFDFIELKYFISCSQATSVTIHFTLTDSQGKSKSIQRHIATSFKTGRSNTISIPVPTFFNLDLNNIKQFEVSCSSGKDYSTDTSIGFCQLKLSQSIPSLQSVHAKEQLNNPSTSFLEKSPNIPKETSLDSPEVQNFLRTIASKTWEFFKTCYDKKTYLIIDHIQYFPSLEVGNYTSPTNIAVHLMGTVGAIELKLTKFKEGQELVDHILQTLEELDKWNGLFFNYYNTSNLFVTRNYVSSVDNAWLAIALLVIKDYFPKLSSRIQVLFDSMNFSKLYDPSIGQYFIGFNNDTQKMDPYHYGLLNSEARIISYITYIKDIDPSHWFRMNRTLPVDWTWQSQPPLGYMVSRMGYSYNQLFYYIPDQNLCIVPSWGGSLFESLMAGLIVNEQQLSPKGFFTNGQSMVKLNQIEAQKHGLDIWGFSPCSNPQGEYLEVGVPSCGVKPYPFRPLITCHAAFLALAYDFPKAINNIYNMLKNYSSYGCYGLFDAIEIIPNNSEGQVAFRYYSLDQGMIFLALSNLLGNHIIQKAVGQYPIIQQLLKENFFDHAEFLKQFRSN